MNIQGLSPVEIKHNELMGVQSVEQKPNQVLFDGIMGGLNTMRETQEVGKMEMSKMLMGNSENAHNALILAEKANLQMQFAGSIRDKGVQGLNQLLNMQV
jgi:flagellar hook-basal body complex protein FliE